MNLCTNAIVTNIGAAGKNRAPCLMFNDPKMTLDETQREETEFEESLKNLIDLE